MKIHQLEKGNYVEIKGLKAKPEKNGLIGRLISFDEATGRWKVRIDGKGEELGVKPENLWAVSISECDPDSTPVPSIFNTPKNKSNLAYGSCDVACMIGKEKDKVDICPYKLVDDGLTFGALGLLPLVENTKSDLPTGHGLLLRGLVSVPSPTGYVEGVRLLHEYSNEFVAVIECTQASHPDTVRC